MAEENYLKMMTDLWESASKTASDSQRNLMQTLATRMGTSFPVLFAPFSLATRHRRKRAKRSAAFSILLWRCPTPWRQPRVRQRWMRRRPHFCRK